MEREKKIGIWIGAGSYFIWGILPMYWKLAGEIDAVEILAHRMIWSFVFMVVLIAIFGRWKSVMTELRQITRQPRTLLAMTAATLLISINWFLFIFSVNGNHILSASLGYYINPLVNIVFAMLLLKERLRSGEMVAVVIAAIGVVLLSISQGAVPWAAISLAITFSLYGLIKKKVSVSTWTGLTIETLIISPFALIYLLFFAEHAFMGYGSGLNAVAIGGGLVTVVPLLLFSSAAKQISYVMLGFLQYLAPTLMLIVAVSIYGETLTAFEWGSFLSIWIALIIYTTSNILYAKRQKKITQYEIKAHHSL
ncbi:permease [Bacillus sp. FJAT-27916]|uniref:EamA family transporter RarD n=1 Tax=Bacillaceae TaxID=186817 RepID=UPI00067148DE|nr:EamA family transporter RarD [Bacillus sp. FJAT-27916]KMY44057.1 permease [Bacillus sp. FJAT-27916]